MSKPKTESAFLEIDAALKAKVSYAQGLLERIQRAAELDPEDPEYMAKVDELAGQVKAARAEEDERKERLKMLARKKSPDARWRARRLAEMKTPTITKKAVFGTTAPKGAPVLDTRRKKP